MGQVDSCTKEYARRHVVFADLFNYYVYDGRMVIQPENLKEMDTTELTLPNVAGRSIPAQKYRDVLKQAVIMEDDTVKSLLILGVENQMYIHYGMPVKTMVYDAINYASQIDRIAKDNREAGQIKGSAEYLSGLRREDRLIPVITLVLYFGQEQWDGALNLHDLLEPVPKDVMRYVSDYKINLISPVMMSDEEIALFRSDFRELATFIKYGKDKDKMKKLMEENEAYRHMDALTAEIANEVTGAKLKLEADEEGKVDMCVAIMGIREEGVQEGIQKGILETLHALILELLSEVSKVPAGLENRIRTITETGDLKVLHKNASKAETIEEFVRMSGELLAKTSSNSYNDTEYKI